MQNFKENRKRQNQMKIWTKQKKNVNMKKLP